MEGATAFSMKSRSAGSNCLFSVAKDNSVIAWDSNTGKPARQVNLGGRVGCVISEEPWISVNLYGVIHAFCLDDEGVDASLSSPVRHITSLSTLYDTLFAGLEDDSIHAWKFGHNFQALLPFKGNGQPVVFLQFGVGQLFSGHMDGMINVWDINNQNCLQTLEAHDGASSGWLTGDLSFVYTHKEEAGVVAMFGMVDLEGKSVLYSSCKDNVIWTGGA